MVAFRRGWNDDLGQTLFRGPSRRGSLGKRRRKTARFLERLEDRTLLAAIGYANNFAAVEGTSTGPIVLGAFKDTAFDTVTGVHAFLNPGGWGDDTPAVTTPLAVTFTGFDPVTGEPNFQVSGVHTYTEEGAYTVTIFVTTDNDGVTNALTPATATVNDAPLSPGPSVTVIGNTGIPNTFSPPLPGSIPSNTVVASFSDGNHGAPASDFQATIDWGDGSPRTTGTVVSTATAGVFDVEGGHVYATSEVFVPKVTLADDGSATATMNGTAIVTDLPVTGGTYNFNAIEGLPTSQFVLATFEDPNSLATVANVNSTLGIGGWGDGTPTVAGVELKTVQVGVDPNNLQPIFEVLGSHTYAESSPPGTPYSLFVIVTTRGGAAFTTTVFRSPPGGGVTVVDAALAAKGASIQAIEGIALTGQLLATFTDHNPGAVVADFTSGGGSVKVDWGDGKPVDTLTAADITALGTPNGVTFTVTGGHTYDEEGSDKVTVTITDADGSVTKANAEADVADARLSATATQPAVNTTESAIFPVPEFSSPIFTGAVATFTDANLFPDGHPNGPASDFKATIDWGDGTPQSAGTVTFDAGTGVFTVTGSHTYADSGANGGAGPFPITVYVVDDGGSKLTVPNTANVADNPIVLTGTLNPKSDSGLSTGTPDVTNIKQPDFLGTSEPFSHVTLTATNTITMAATPIGAVQAGSDGAWNIKAKVPLADGHYTITATAVDQFGKTTTTALVTITSELLIDTVGPVIDGMFFNRLNGQVDYIIKDPVNPDGSAPSGVWVNSLLNSSNYLLTKVHANKAFPGKWIVTNVTATPDPKIPFAYDVAVTFNGGKIIHGGFYLITIRDSSDGNSSVQDLAENHLDGQFYGTFPSGNGIPGSDFIAELQSYHNKVFAPQTIEGTATAANGGVGGVPTNAVHSGVFVPLLPPGASPIFSTSTSVTTGDPPAGHKKVKGQTVIKQKHGQSVLSNTNGKHTELVLSKNHPKGPKHS
jgi:hypothetical protein